MTSGFLYEWAVRTQGQKGEGTIADRRKERRLRYRTSGAPTGDTGGAGYGLCVCGYVEVHVSTCERMESVPSPKEQDDRRTVQ